MNNNNKVVFQALLLGFAGVVLVVIFIVGIVLLIKVGQERWTESERGECFKWKEQEANYPLFYTLDWQKMQCRQYKIDFNK